MFRKILIALCLVSFASPVMAQIPEIPLPSTEKIDGTKENPSELIPIEENSDSKLPQKENNEAYYLNIAYSLLNEKKNKEAIEFLDKAITLNHRNPDSYYGRGYAYHELNQYQKAIEDFTKAINLNPQNGLYYAVRGNSYNNLYQPQKAKFDYIKAGKLFKKSGDIENYNRIQEALKGTEQNIAILASENASKKSTRELLIKRACSMAKQGYTDGEIRNEIYRLVRINTPAPGRTASSFSYGRSYDSTTIAVMNLVMGLDELSAKYYDNVIENEASDIMQVAKKRCKF